MTAPRKRTAAHRARPKAPRRHPETLQQGFGAEQGSQRVDEEYIRAFQDSEGGNRKEGPKDCRAAKRVG